MNVIIFSESSLTNLFDGTNSINESGLHWALFDINVGDFSLLTQVVEQGTDLNIVNGEGRLSVTADVGSYVMVIQSPTTPAIGAYINMEVVEPTTEDLYLGDTLVTELYIGNTPVTEMYLGDTKVF